MLTFSGKETTKLLWLECRGNQYVNIWVSNDISYPTVKLNSSTKKSIAQLYCHGSKYGHWAFELSQTINKSFQTNLLLTYGWFSNCSDKVQKGNLNFSEWEFFIQMRDAETQQSLNVEEVTNILFSSSLRWFLRRYLG